MTHPIKEVTTWHGYVQYHFVISTDPDPATNRPRRMKFVFATKQEAHQAYAQITSEIERGTFVSPERAAISRPRAKASVGRKTGESRSVSVVNEPTINQTRTRPTTSRVPSVPFTSPAINR